MNRIDQKFEQLKKENKKALIPFITGGDGGLEVTEELVYTLIENGADLIEIGVPFSDPMAEGVVIQEASKRALDADTTMRDLFALVKKIRTVNAEIPILFMLYANSIFRFGKSEFFSLCNECGIDGVIVPDLPYEEQGEILPEAEKSGVYSILLVSPTSGEKRTETIAKKARGFLYCVSSTGTTGVRGEFSTNFKEFFTAIDKYVTVPTAIGFGISSPEQVREMKQYTDGIIVGSAFVRLVGEYKENSPEQVGKFTAALNKETYA